MDFFQIPMGQKSDRGLIRLESGVSQATVLPEDSRENHFLVHVGCRQKSASHGCRTKVIIFLLAVTWEFVLSTQRRP